MGATKSAPGCLMACSMTQQPGATQPAQPWVEGIEGTDITKTQRGVQSGATTEALS